MADDEDKLVTKPFKFVTGTYLPSLATALLSGRRKANIFAAGFDARFPNQNQTKHCWQNYVDYHKCIIAKGEDFAPCRQFFLAYRSLCPSAWCERWDDQRENGNFPVNLES
ncbi:Cytochrome c oxidase subunit 6B [Lecanora helva]